MSNNTAPDKIRRRSLGIISRITRRWWSIVLVWLALSLPALYLIHQLVEPTFEAVSILHIDPSPWTLREPSERIDFKGAELYVQAQIGVIMSDRVLAGATTRPEIANLRTIASAEDPRNFLREHMTVEIVKAPFLIRVALELGDKNEAAAIVNAVVHSYLEYCGEHQRIGNSSLRKALAYQLEKYDHQINEKRSELKKLYQRE
jgi:polysaccharide biosynthesis transport protein